MSTASDEADLIARMKDNAHQLYSALDALWNAAANGEFPKNEDLLFAETVLERIDGRA